MTDKELAAAANQIMVNSYAPYSGFRVGAALETSSGKVYTGVNVENASYGASCCAERTAVFKAVSDGERVIKSIAIASDSDDFIYPCGICRQVFAEFGSKDLKIICTNKSGDYITFNLEQLLPNPFKKKE